MSNNNNFEELENRLDFLGLDKAVEYIEQHRNDIPSDVIQLIHMMLAEDYVTKYNRLYGLLINTSGLRCKRGILSDIKTGDGRKYNDNALEQVKELSFLESRKNVCVFGESGAGKSYLIASVSEELCKRGIRNRFVDYIKLMDMMTQLRHTDKVKYNKKLESLAKIPVLLIDDFLSDDAFPDDVTVMFCLVKLRETYQNPTIVATQYDPQEWVELMTGTKKTRKGEADSIRRRLVDNAYLITIAKN